MPTLFIDRDAWSHLLDSRLREAGIPFVAHREVFEPDAPDPEWLAEVGRRGWLVVTRDKNIRRRPNELRAARDAGVHLFALTSGNLSAAETATIVIQAWPAFQREAAHTGSQSIDKNPFGLSLSKPWRITSTGSVRTDLGVRRFLCS